MQHNALKLLLCIAISLLFLVDLSGLLDQGGERPTSKVELLAMLRDQKRRRQSYRAKNVHVTKKSYTEVSGTDLFHGRQISGSECVCVCVFVCMCSCVCVCARACMHICVSYIQSYTLHCCTCNTFFSMPSIYHSRSSEKWSWARWKSWCQLRRKRRKTSM